MEDMNKFQEMLADIIEVAKVQGNKLSIDEIKSLFGDIELNEMQYEHIFAYLAANQVKIEGYVEVISEYTKAVQQDADNQDAYDQEAYELEEEHNKEERNNEEPNDEELSEEESSDEEQSDEEQSENLGTDRIRKIDSNHLKEEDSIYLKMYLQDLEAIKESTIKEEYELIEKILKGDNNAKNRFIEAKLKMVIQIASEYKNKGITLEDLIQEGNIGLLSSIESLSELEGKENWKEFVTNYVRKYIESALEEQNDNNSFENRMVKKIKYIDDSANELAEDLGRGADVHELAAYTKLSVEEIKDILNMTVDTIKVSK